MTVKKLPLKKVEIISEHDMVLNTIKKALKGVENNLEKQIDNFHADPNYKTFTGIRKDKGYNKWKNDVSIRFYNTCCVCLSKENIIVHHLFSYKYYPDLRTNVDNGVCLCSICHDNFNEAYSSASTLKQFIEYRNKFKGKPQNRNPRKFLIEYITKDEYEKELADRKKKAAKLILTKEQKGIINGFEQLKMNLINESQSLKKQYGDANGIKIDFRGKTTTSKSAMRKLQYEIMRINTLITCNKLRDKTILAKEFHMPIDEFLKILQDPNQYLKFSDAEITHLNLIKAQKYKSEMEIIYAALNEKIH